MLISSPESEILVVQMMVGHLKVRVINGYGPQESENRQLIMQFWQDVETEIISAKDDNCCILIQMDANAKLGKCIIPGDPHDMSDNGKILSDLITRQNLCVLNADPMCKGVITRHRSTKQSEEKSVLDYIICCQVLRQYLEHMMIDENKTHVLTKYSSRRGKQTIIKSDHNLLQGTFSISYNKVKRKVVREVFNFKTIEGQKKFFEITDNTKQFSDCFSNENLSFQSQTNKFWKRMKGAFHQSFK